MKSHIFCLLVAGVVSQTVFFAFGQSDSNIAPSAQLQQSIAELQKSPGDQALREKIIKLALTADPKPVVPSQVDELIGAATYAFKNAKSEADFADAAESYQKALLLAPWVMGVNSWGLVIPV